MATGNSILGPCAYNLLGETFTRLTVKEFAGRSKHGAILWKCECSCGAIRVIASENLTGSKGTKSCGCLAREISSKLRKTHGLSRTAEYKVWGTMIDRCHKLTSTKYYMYGARGIAVCQRWRDSFLNFLADMGNRPSSKHQIEREDNNGNYEPGNCSWKTAKEQARNRRSNHLVTYQGITLCAAEWAERLEFKKSMTIISRLANGWSIDEALSTPEGSRRHHQR